MRWADEPAIFLTRKLWEFSKDGKKQVIKYATFFFISNIVDLSQPLIIAWVFNTIQTEGLANPYKLLGIIALIPISRLVFWMFHGPARVWERTNAFRVRANFQKYLLNGIMALPASWHTAHHSGDTIDKVKKASEALYTYTAGTFEIISAVMRIILSYFVLAYFNLHATYIVLVMSFIAFSIILRYDKTLVPQYKKLDRAENTIAEKIFDTISNITTVLILKIERLVEKQIWKEILKPFGLHKKNAGLIEDKWFFVSMTATTMTALVLASFILSSIVNETAILAGTLFALYDYVNRISSVFFHFAYKYGQIVQQKTKVENVKPITDLFTQQEIIIPTKLTRWKELHIDKLHFSYHGKEGDMHLKNISLAIKKGEKIALVGESGSGKTTFLKLLRGLYTPRKVRLTVDNKEIPQGFKALQEQITLIPQEPELFAATIKENITMGVSHSLKTIKRFARIARFSSVVTKLPSKYNSSIVEKGVNLSGGEKQRLALTRGLLACKDKEIILLDEPTSSVDAKNELHIYEGIFRAFKKKTIISSIHRLHLLHMFDTVYVFKKGKIVASGSVHKLRRSSKEFKAMWKRYQSKKK